MLRSSSGLRVLLNDSSHTLIYIRQVLALKLLAVVPNLMMDERTMSTITWMNSPRRARQHVKTLRDHIKIRQWHSIIDGSVVCISYSLRIFTLIIRYWLVLDYIVEDCTSPSHGQVD